MRQGLFAILTGTVLAGCSVIGVRSGLEQPAYTVLATIGEQVEVRRYGPRLSAETTVPATADEEARGAAFRLLAGYIFGANRAKAEIAMTAPVATERASQTIAMTAPVATSADASGLTMRFFLPASLSLATAPVPDDARVRLHEVPGDTLAVLRFSGRPTEARIAAETARLGEIVGSTTSWRAAGIPSAMFYDPPWTVPFLRRNEVALPVAQ